VETSAAVTGSYRWPYLAANIFVAEIPGPNWPGVETASKKTHGTSGKTGTATQPRSFARSAWTLLAGCEPEPGTLSSLINMTFLLLKQAALPSAYVGSLSF